jgi:hypothetical protein
MFERVAALGNAEYLFLRQADERGPLQECLFAQAELLVNLRNDPDIKRIVVLGLRRDAETAAIAGTMAQVDGIALLDPEPRVTVTPASPKIPSLAVSGSPVAPLLGTVSDPAAIEEGIRRIAEIVDQFAEGLSVAHHPVTDRRSPRRFIHALLKDVRVAVEFSSPMVRGREVWRSLIVPGRVWMPGADEISTLTFGESVRLGGTELAQGEYGVFFVPGPDAVMILSKGVRRDHLAYRPDEDVARVVVREEALEVGVEGLTFVIDGQSPCWRFGLEWERRRYTTSLAADRSQVCK